MRATHAAALVEGFQLAFLVGAGLMLGGVVVIVALLRAPPCRVARDRRATPEPVAVAA